MGGKIIMTGVTKIGDPFVLPYNGKYYMYATSDGNGFKVWESDDLVQWKDAGLCYSNSQWAMKNNNYWAPEVYLYRGKFWMLYTARWQKNQSLRLGLAVADSPLGQFADVADKPFDFGYAAIDGNILFDDDGKNYLYYSRDICENIVDGKGTSQIYAVRLSGDLQETQGEPVMVSTPDTEWEQKAGDRERWNEGPAVIKHSGKYYMFYSVNPFWSPYYSVCYSVAGSPLGPFVKAAENPVLKLIEGVMTGPGHNSFFTTFDGRLMTAYHVHTDMGKPSGDRRACFSEVLFENAKAVVDYR